MPAENIPEIGAPVAPTVARAQLDGLLTDFIARIPGAQQALLGTGDGLKLAYTDQTVDEADTTAAVISGMSALARQQFKNNPGGLRQVVAEHDAGFLFLMSAGTASKSSLGTVLAVVTTPEADSGLVGYEMGVLITRLDEHLITQARRNTMYGQGL
ncbi:roadblock/LC7 domain-containing protein [Streptomyces sp. NPDC001165]|uniref:roadblock/LC7 domain-containing protein n=1 Tax=Streptomyces sp. NPDC001165 TaxID=3364546 RepID=UPI0036B17793